MSTLIISHRGNLDGIDYENENNPKKIERVFDLGFEVEIDVWRFGNNYFLGHDEPKYKINKNFLKRDGLWCHAKNDKAFEFLLNDGIHCFWHENDKYTLTSKSIPWCFPKNYHPLGITVILGKEEIPPMNIGGICTDYPIYYSDLLNQLQPT